MDKRLSILGHEFALTWYDLFVSFVLILFGAVLIIWPDTIREYLLIGIGALFMISGLIQLIRYFRATGAERMSHNGFVVGLFQLVAGLEIILSREALSSLLILIFGIALIVVAAYYVQGLMNLRYMNSKRWVFCLVAAIISLVCGVAVLFVAKMRMEAVGIMLTLQGVLFVIFRVLYHRVCEKGTAQQTPAQE